MCKYILHGTRSRISARSLGSMASTQGLGHLDQAVQVAELMCHQGIHMSRDFAYSLLHQCTKVRDVEGGRRVLGLMGRSGLHSVNILGDHLIRLFGSSGCFHEANQVFDEISTPSAYTWSAIINASSKLGECGKTVELLDMMQLSILKLDAYAYIPALKACGTGYSIEHGRVLHERIVNSKVEFNVAIGSVLVDMYAKCGSLTEARKVFDQSPNHNVVSWGAMLTGYAQHKDGIEALKLFEKMQQAGVVPDKIIFSSLLKACGSISAIVQGRVVHDQVVENGLQGNLVIGNALIDMYVRCGSLEEAYNVFNRLGSRDIVSWSAIIAGNAQYGNGTCAIENLQKMQEEGIEPEKTTFLGILKACINFGTLEDGRLIHVQIINKGLDRDLVLRNVLIDMYAKCGSLEEACNVFDKSEARDIVSWGAMIAGYAQHGYAFAALDLFDQMQHKNIKLERPIFLSILKACGTTRALEKGRLIHDKIMKNEIQADVVIGNALVDMYAKCGDLEEARAVFENLKESDVISWSAMIAGYADHGDGLMALELYSDMQQKKIYPGKATFLSILKACTKIGAIEQGKVIHDQAIQNGLESDVQIGCTLVDMYAKCGNFEEARILHERLPPHNVVSWGAMISGYARSGKAMHAGCCLEEMLGKGIKPNGVIFTSIIAACSHIGLVEEGRYYFKSIADVHNIDQNSDHYNCMTDLLGRAGCLFEAEGLLNNIEPNIIAWMSLLTSCRTYHNLVLGNRCFKQVVNLNPQYAAGYVLMSKIYLDAHMWDDANKIEELRKQNGAWKKPAKAWIEINGSVHEFVVGDKSHPQSVKIYALLKRLTRQIRDHGYVLQISSELPQTPKQDLEDPLCGHCERLAIAFGIINTSQGTTIRATKNLRVCGDCHSMTKHIAKVESRKIIIRDAYRIHQFEDGLCSCGDYF